jgi:RNA polymerase sigma-70 factor (ECF subfamily)
MNDEDRLVSQLRAGEEEAFEAVVTHYQETLIRMAMRYVANRATAEEVVQETWIAVMSGLNRFERRSSLHAWICAILIHKAKDRGVREKRQKVFSDFKLETDDWSGEINLSRFRPCKEWPGPAEFSQHLWDDQTPEKLLASREATACMWHAIETLPTHQKEVLMLRDVQGIHTIEVCQQLKISETNFYVRLHRARECVKVAVKAAQG